MPAANEPARHGGVAFLLTQLGTHSADLFASALQELNLTPPLAGIMRMLHSSPGISQQQLAERLGVAPSRIVSYVDDLEARDWIRRTRDDQDRRVNLVSLTTQGRDAFAALAAVSRQHERAITAGLSAGERETLLELLTTVAGHQGLNPGIHPGYRTAPSG